MVSLNTPKGKLKGFLTSLIGSVRYPCEKLLKIYWKHREIEIGFSELKRQQLRSYGRF